MEAEHIALVLDKSALKTRSLASVEYGGVCAVLVKKGDWNYADYNVLGLYLGRTGRGGWNFEEGQGMI